ncbi:hypothetical protein J4732_03905 [Serratia marcescens]|uniref:Uncharacterized protein n=1 Tax=Serratia marcescens TaxID=615 RepID=A0A939NJI1_SERMA|nr:hypothetical protein [Serratia marcescens]
MTPTIATKNPRRGRAEPRRAVPMSLGGADAHIELKTGDEDVERRLFVWWSLWLRWPDIDLEQARSAPPIIKTVLPWCKRLLRRAGKTIISMALNSLHLRTNGHLPRFINALGRLL